MSYAEHYVHPAKKKEDGPRKIEKGEASAPPELHHVEVVLSRRTRT